MDWVKDAGCRAQDPELFFPPANAGPVSAQVEAAKAVCAACVVREECLEWAIRTFQDSGVWGGLAEEERRALRRARRRSARMAVAS